MAQHLIASSHYGSGDHMKMYDFFGEVSKPFDPSRRPVPPTPEEMKKLFAAAARYGYWVASPEENAAIGISL